MSISSEVRFGDLFPPISNCTGGAQNEALHGSLSPEQVAEVSETAIAPDISDQQALSSVSECQHHGEVEILYFPTINLARISPRSGKIIGAMCVQADCEYNTSEKA